MESSRAACHQPAATDADMARRGYVATPVGAPLQAASPGDLRRKSYRGGTGKTPLVGWLADRLAEKGKTPAILTMGYGGNEPARSGSIRKTMMLRPVVTSR